MSLLGEDERRHADAGFADYADTKYKTPLSLEDKRAMALLCILCAWCFLPSLTDPIEQLSSWYVWRPS
jgi:hypothetical protein